MLGMAYIRVLEVATFYFMFQLQPVGSVAHVQVCGTTSLHDLRRGGSDRGLPREDRGRMPHEVSADGKFSWEEVECLGACANAPMAQIGKDYLRGPDGGEVRGDARRLRARRGAAAGAAERAVRLGAAGRADGADRRAAGGWRRTPR